ncbi:MAG: hypothetical protein EHM38_05590 [Geobacteraceae bacterium]|nr:MAG: hypothetical protein EHM38_05590 [Geobacteraceae bacterium]RPJ12462.1 MAG: hypothetical protein EHM37_09050 [Deltaproteobacteria bacterium]RPJ16236.1 MAG: hypothetical protein EHM37_02470 [Deltaproteobacteria bacterium]
MDSEINGLTDFHRKFFRLPQIENLFRKNRVPPFCQYSTATIALKELLLPRPTLLHAGKHLLWNVESILEAL